MSSLLPAVSGRYAASASAVWPGQAQCHTCTRGRRAAHAQPCLSVRRRRLTLSAWCSCDAQREPRRGRAVCRAARDPGLLNVPGPPKRLDGRFSATWRRLQRTFPVLKYEQLLKRVAGTFVLVAFARLGHFMPVEGIDPFAGQYTPGEGLPSPCGRCIRHLSFLRCSTAVTPRAPVHVRMLAVSWPLFKGPRVRYAPILIALRGAVESAGGWQHRDQMASVPRRRAAGGAVRLQRHRRGPIHARRDPARRRLHHLRGRHGFVSSTQAPHREAA